LRGDGPSRGDQQTALHSARQVRTQSIVYRSSGPRQHVDPIGHTIHSSESRKGASRGVKKQVEHNSWTCD
jgi:hypothetical protein